jgi:RNA polymerase sigma factor (sigma-70 family)
LDAVRQRRRHEAEPLPGAGPAAPAAEIPDRRGRSPAEETAGREIAALIREALDRLSPDHRRTLLLRFADGLSYADIATATGVSIGTVMSRLFNGRRKLQRLLSQAGLGPRPAPPVNGVKEDLHEPRVLA